MNYIKEGQIISGRYQIIELLGEGATSRVYLAYDLTSEMNVALKILKNENINEKKIHSFQREARAISRLNHENIIKIYEINEDAGMHYIVQEYVDGITLKEYINNTEKTRIAEVVKMVEQILEGLEHAHENKVIHKDIKSQNILIDINQKIKITDFGIADILEDDATKTQSLMGTPQYVAPEVLSRSRPTAQTDIYSVGILLYELLIGHAPFSGEKPTVIILKQLNQPLPSVCQQREDVPQSLENVLIKATAKNLDNRYKTAQEMLDDLSTCLLLRKRNEEILVLENDFDYKTESTIEFSDFNKLKEEIDTKEAKSKKVRYVVLGLIILFLIGIIIGFSVFSNTDQEMPYLKNQNIIDAQDVLKNMGVDENNIIIKKEKNADIEANRIISTEPAEGEIIEKDSKIILTVSQGPEEIEIENYVGMSESEATTKLKNLGFNVTINYINSDAAQGTILNQNPLAGSKSVANGDVTLTVSEGKKKVKVINFLNMKESEVDKWADENNLNISKKYSCNDTYDKNHIFAQDPKYNTEIEENTSISVTISSGACPKDDTSGTKTDATVTTDTKTT